MKHKDFFDLFKEQDAQVRIQPKQQTWRRLEQRLQQNDKRHFVVIKRSWALAASVALLVGMISILSLYWSAAYNNNPYAARPERFEVLDTAEETPYQWQYAKNIYNKAIEDNNAVKRVLVLKNEPKTQLNKVDLFKWLVGRWQQVNSDQQAYEQWDELTEKKAIKGTGTLFNTDGEPLFSETMLIELENNHLYYKIKLPNFTTYTAYKLTSFQHQKAVFENMEIDFPNQIILYRHTPTSFSTILQNKATKAIDNQQRSYFNQRNTLIPEHAVRRLRKVE